MFGLSVNMALNASLESTLLPQLINVYKELVNKFAPSIYLEKSHTNIWIAEKLDQAFGRAQFIGIERNPYATVASMLRHREVLAWHGRWRQFPVPSRFLGISAEDAKHYDEIPVAAQCAMRWLSHNEQMKKLRIALQERLFVINYEVFAHQTEKTILELQQFLQLKDQIPIPEVRIASLYKWREQLTEIELEQIQGVVGIAPDEADEIA